MNKFESRIKEIRLENNLTYSQLAGEFGKSEGAIRAWESGRTNPDVDTVIALAKRFNVSTDYLLGASDAKKPENETLISDFGLSEAAIESIRSLKTAQPPMPDSSEDTRTLLDVFNGLLADSSFLTFLSLMRMLTNAEKWSFTQWEGDALAKPHLYIGDAERTAFLEKWLSDVIEVIIDDMRKENLHTKTQNANVNLFSDKD